MTRLSHAETWKILEEIIIEFRKKSIAVPEHVMDDLKSAKTMTKLLETGEGQGEIGPKVEQYLSSVEAYVVTEAEKNFPPERIDAWLRRLEASTCDVCADRAKPTPKESPRFVAGLPRDQHWVRVNPIASLPREKLEELAKDSGLAVKVEEDGHLIVYGQAEDIHLFMKTMTLHASKERS